MIPLQASQQARINDLGGVKIKSVRSNFIVTSTGPGPLESGPDDFTLAIFNNSTIWKNLFR